LIRTKNSVQLLFALVIIIIKFKYS